MTIGLCVIGLLIVVLLILFNPYANLTRKINNIINIDRSVCDYIDSFEGWSVSPIKCDSLRIVIFPTGLPSYYLYVTYKGRKPNTKELESLYKGYIKPTFSRAQYQQITVGELCRYKQYKVWYDEHMRLMQKYGIFSKEAEQYFVSFFRQIENPNEWRRYQKMRERY